MWGDMKDDELQTIGDYLHAGVKVALKLGEIKLAQALFDAQLKVKRELTERGKYAESIS